MTRNEIFFSSSNSDGTFPILIRISIDQTIFINAKISLRITVECIGQVSVGHLLHFGHVIVFAQKRVGESPKEIYASLIEAHVIRVSENMMRNIARRQQAHRVVKVVSVPQCGYGHKWCVEHFGDWQPTVMEKLLQNHNVKLPVGSI